ncbi:VanZ family protein [Spirochaetota bacterium]
MKIFKYFIPIIIYVVMIFITSTIDMPRISYRVFKKIEVYAHFIEYFILYLLLYYSLYKSFPMMSQVKKFIIVLIISSIVGISDELYQSLSKYRRSQLSDFVADIMGCLFAIIVIKIFTLIVNRNRENRKEPVI